jgi:hypothetical protein
MVEMAMNLPLQQHPSSCYPVCTYLSWPYYHTSHGILTEYCIIPPLLLAILSHNNLWRHALIEATRGMQTCEIFPQCLLEKHYGQGFGVTLALHGDLSGGSAKRLTNCIAFIQIETKID